MGIRHGKISSWIRSGNEVAHMNWFKSLMRNIWNRITGENAEGRNILEQLTDLAIPTVEALIHVDLNGDGRVAARTEILAAAQELGIGRLMRILDPTVFDGLDLEDLKKYLAIARTAKIIAASLGADSVPMFRVISQIVETAYLLATGNAVKVDLQRKGLV